MNILRLIFDPAILIIISTFVFVVAYTIKKYNYVYTNLNILHKFLSRFKKSDLLYRFGEFDKVLSANGYIAGMWQEFRNTLVFSESIAIKQQDNSVKYQKVSKDIENIQTTVDPLYFFNEESLVTSKYNNKFMQIVPTLLTGMGPLFTFLNIAVAFTKIDFSSNDTVLTSISGLMSSMQVAALCSVLAVSASLIFLFFEKVCYNKLCRVPLQKVQDKVYSLFDNISSEKFLIELLRETKIQNSNLISLLSSLPPNITDSFKSSVVDSVVPYMENMLYGINTLNDSIKNLNDKLKNNGSDDVVDGLF
ncbi:hypothetical protein IJG72_04540 [bacterium]|nr:hypothetical protein [bacterium]